MNKTALISARIDPHLKNKVELVFKELGLTATQAITLFYKQVELQRGLPFNIKIPNDVTIKALDEAISLQNLETFENVEALFADLKI